MHLWETVGGGGVEVGGQAVPTGWFTLPVPSLFWGREVGSHRHTSSQQAGYGSYTERSLSQGDGCWDIHPNASFPPQRNIPLGLAICRPTRKLLCK